MVRNKLIFFLLQEKGRFTAVKERSFRDVTGMWLWVCTWCCRCVGDVGSMTTRDVHFPSPSDTDPVPSVNRWSAPHAFLSPRSFVLAAFLCTGRSLWLFISVCGGCSHSAGRHRVDLCGCSFLCAVGVHTLLADTGYEYSLVHLCFHLGCSDLKVSFKSFEAQLALQHVVTVFVPSCSLKQMGVRSKEHVGYMR